MLSKRDQDLAEWEEYNQKKPTSSAVIYDKDGRKTLHKSYTHHFFDDYKLTKYLNKSCNTIVQLGAANGEFINKYKGSQWNVIGYDYSSEAIKNLEDKNIIARMQDLNLLNPNTQQLSYADVLTKDIEKPANIVLIRVLEFLDLKALNVLLHFIINKAAEESVIFIAGKIEENDEQETKVNTRTPNYKASFFGPRTDMKFLVSKNVNKDDELLVIQKKKNQ